MAYLGVKFLIRHCLLKYILAIHFNILDLKLLLVVLDVCFINILNLIGLLFVKVT